MPKVPNTNTFASTDIKASLEGYSSTGYISSIIDNGSGKARFLVSGGTQKLAVGSEIIISNTSMYNGPHTITALSVGNWFETGSPYYGSTDTGNWNIDLNDLIAYFDWADSIKFDPQYEGLKDRQSNFRNYGPVGTLVNVDNHDHGGLYNGIDGNLHWFFVTSGDYGVRCYDMNTAGVLDLKSTFGAPGNEHFDDLWVQSTKVFLTSTDGVAGENYLRSFTYNVVSGVMAAAHIIQTSISTGMHNVFGDGTDLIFVVQPTGSSSFGIRSYTYDGAGNLFYKTAYTADSATYYKGVYANGYLFVVGSNGITSFTRNTTTGVLTRIDNDNTGLFVGNSIIHDSASGLLFIGSQTDGAIVYSHSSGILTQEYRQGSGMRAFPAYHSAANYLYYTDGSNVLRYRLNASKDLDYIGSQAFGINNKLFIWNDWAPNIVLATDGYDGIRTYLIDYE